MAELPARSITFEKVSAGGASELVDRPVADETPIAIEFNGLGYAVLMASAADLDDLAYGFASSERIIDSMHDIIDVAAIESAPGRLLRVTLAEARLGRIVERVRHRVSESSCGLCGIENLEQALRPLPRVTARSDISADSIFKALSGLNGLQPLNRATGAVHAAALCRPDGAVVMVREDIGRHNAFDKLIGAMMRQSLGWDGGFTLLSSRCSYELVEKAALANCPRLVTLSAPSALAVARAKEAGVELSVLARHDSFLRPV